MAPLAIDCVVTEETLGQARPLDHHLLGLLSVIELGGLLDLLRRFAHLLDRLSQVAKAALCLTDTGRKFLHPFFGWCSQTVGRTAHGPQQPENHESRAQRLRTRARLSPRMMGLRRKSRSTARTMGRKKARAK